MSYDFLYIDDLAIDNANGIILALESTSEIKVTYDNPKGDWEDEINRFNQQARNYQGIILDLRLQDKKNRAGKFSNYSGAILAHQFREAVKGGYPLIKDIPIVLLSGNSNLQRYFDDTGKDAFDLCVSRDNLNSDESFKNLRRKLYALAKGYIDLNNNKTELHKILNIDEKYLNALDERFKYEIKSLANNPAHVMAKFIIQEFLDMEGLVISEHLLAARLGIDISQSADWNNLLEVLKPCRYYGVFADGWSRWWAGHLQDWWSSNFSEKNLRSTPSAERVGLIIERFNLKNIVQATKVDKARSDSFWVICSGLKKPIDPVDGLVIAGQDNFYPWQEKKYVSYEAAIHSTLVEEWRQVAPSEKNKLDQLKKLYSNERIRR